MAIKEVKEPPDALNAVGGVQGEPGLLWLVHEIKTGGFCGRNICVTHISSLLHAGGVCEAATGGGGLRQRAAGGSGRCGA